MLLSICEFCESGYSEGCTFSVGISVVKCSWVKCSRVLQCSDGLSIKVSNIIRRLMDNVKLLFICILLLSHSFIFFSFYFLSMYIWFYSCLIM